jgi:hypothetical protein
MLSDNASASAPARKEKKKKDVLSYLSQNDSSTQRTRNPMRGKAFPDR